MKHFALIVLVLVLAGCATTHKLAKVYDANGGHGTAFAIAIDGDHYICVTAAHVTLRPEGTVLAVRGVPVEVVSEHQEHDVAVLRVPVASGRLRVYDVAEAVVGPAVALGFASLSSTMVETHGRIISLASGPAGDELLADIRAIPGMSGGPVLQNGKVVGIIVGCPPGFGNMPHTGLSWMEPIGRVEDLLGED